MDTTSNAMARILSILGQHPEVQEKIRAELGDAFKDQEELDYDTLSSLPYLDAVVKETLRV
jgi:cytochrome P450